MKLYLETVSNRTSLLAILIATHLSTAQLEPFLHDLIASCAKSNSLNCESLLDIYNPQNLLAATGDADPQYVSLRYRNRILPRRALYEDNNLKYVRYQLPFVSGWKSQYGKETLKGTDTNNLQTRSRKPYNNENTNKRTQYNFSSWGGKRAYDSILSGDDQPISAKREPNFSSWGGKRTQKFFNWGGKRSVPVADEISNEMSETYEHQIMKRQVDQNKPIKMTDNGRPTNESCEILLCVNELPIHLQDLFKEFVEWSRKQPEQKKGSIYRKAFDVSTLHSPENLSSRVGSFYPWGGKRNSKQN